ncbi:hypothetical protein thsps21_09270 [Pseudomonas sp. No.21]
MATRIFTPKLVAYCMTVFMKALTFSVPTVTIVVSSMASAPWEMARLTLATPGPSATAGAQNIAPPVPPPGPVFQP